MLQKISINIFYLPKNLEKYVSWFAQTLISTTINTDNNKEYVLYTKTA